MSRDRFFVSSGREGAFDRHLLLDTGVGSRLLALLCSTPLWFFGIGRDREVTSIAYSKAWHGKGKWKQKGKGREERRDNIPRWNDRLIDRDLTRIELIAMCYIPACLSICLCIVNTISTTSFYFDSYFSSRLKCFFLFLFAWNNVYTKIRLKIK